MRNLQFKPVSHDGWCPKENRAGVVLAIIVNETNDAKLARKVNQQATHVAASFKHISNIPNNHIKQTLGLLFYNSVKDKVSKLGFPHNVADHFLGMTRTIYKEKIIGRLEDRKYGGKDPNITAKDILDRATGEK